MSEFFDVPSRCTALTEGRRFFHTAVLSRLYDNSTDNLCIITQANSPPYGGEEVKDIGKLSAVL